MNVHYMSPFAIQLSETFGIRWYGLSYLAGFLTGYLIITWLSKNKLSPIPAEKVADLISYLAFGTMIGGRIGYCLFYAPDLLFSIDWISLGPIKLPMWSALAVWKGGMASHGGIIGLGVASILFARKYKIKILHILDLATFGGAIAIFYGRIANFINGELYGRVCESKCFYPLKFPEEMNRWLSVEGFSEPLKNLFDVVKTIGPLSLPSGQQLNPDKIQWEQWVSTNSIYNMRVYIDYIKQKVAEGHEGITAALSNVLLDRHPSQLYQAFGEGLFVFLVLIFVWRKARKPGVVAATWCVTYAVMRILGEQFRMPDAQIGYQFLGLTRGQVLSLAQLLFGLALLVIVLKKKNETIGGWGKVFK